MNSENIRNCLIEAGYEAELTPDASTLTLAFQVGERQIRLAHTIPDELLRPPKFRFDGGYDGKLAHVGSWSGTEHPGRCASATRDRPL